ncbi:glycosyl transferase [Sphingobium lactosutens]|uniref:glycosyltransferase family 2 protein n=1 Tax=Sphingobium lactosutens TaxID=522773 RepID=UPI0015BBF90D|nr:glycosyltransferase family 2 protein [Sphingobium lactosutens]NWK95843.1 glycosyl transferase [Sphingobium lactosutens]
MAALFLWVIAGLVVLPLLVVSAECCAALLHEARAEPLPLPPPIAVLIPAHDEALCIAGTLRAVATQLRPEDRMIVIADNCSDATARIARAHGAQVLERRDPIRRGKGYALAFGRDHLANEPPGVVLVIDADTIPAAGAIGHIAAAAVRDNAALQGCYLIEGPTGEPRIAISTLAFRLKNLVRQKGLQALSGHALLQGSGMAFPWRMFSTAPLATACLVEDLQLGIDLYLRGNRVGFVEAARFSSPISGMQGTMSQRTRWEHGSMASAPGHVGRLLKAALTGRTSGWMLAMDLAVPPLGMLAMLSALALLPLLAGGLALGDLAPFTFLVVNLTFFLLSLVLVWRRWGRDLISASTLYQLLLYLFWKAPLLTRFLVRRQREWVRTDRDPPSQFP